MEIFAVVALDVALPVLVVVIFELHDLEAAVQAVALCTTFSFMLDEEEIRVEAVVAPV